MEDLTHEKTEMKAIPVGKINKLSLTLDVPYLEQCLSDMRDSHSMRAAASILDPDPFTHNERQDLYASQINQLDIMIQLAKNANNIMEATLKLEKKNQNEGKMKKFFDL